MSPLMTEAMTMAPPTIVVASPQNMSPAIRETVVFEGPPQHSALL